MWIWDLIVSLTHLAGGHIIFVVLAQVWPVFDIWGADGAKVPHADGARLVVAEGQIHEVIEVCVLGFCGNGAPLLRGQTTFVLIQNFFFQSQTRTWSYNFFRVANQLFSKRTYLSFSVLRIEWIEHIYSKLILLGPGAGYPIHLHTCTRQINDNIGSKWNNNDYLFSQNTVAFTSNSSWKLTDEQTASR